MCLSPHRERIFMTLGKTWPNHQSVNLGRAMTLFLLWVMRRRAEAELRFSVGTGAPVMAVFSVCKMVRLCCVSRWDIPALCTKTRNEAEMASCLELSCTGDYPVIRKGNCLWELGWGRSGVRWRCWLAASYSQSTGGKSKTDQICVEEPYHTNLRACNPRKCWIVKWERFCYLLKHITLSVIKILMVNEDQIVIMESSKKELFVVIWYGLFRCSIFFTYRHLTVNRQPEGI